MPDARDGAFQGAWKGNLRPVDKDPASGRLVDKMDVRWTEFRPRKGSTGQWGRYEHPHVFETTRLDGGRDRTRTCDLLRVKQAL